MTPSCKLGGYMRQALEGGLEVRVIALAGDFEKLRCG